MTESQKVGRGELRELEERVVAIFDLPDAEQAAAFAELRGRHPHRDGLLRRWERAALAIDAGERSLRSVSAAVERERKRPVPAAIAGYKILDVLGEGGMGVVYLAEQLQPVRRRVALKVVRSGLDSGDVIARFESERQALAMMTHGNIARVLDAGTTDDGRPFFALEHVPGMPITEYCDHHKLTLRERIELFQKVCGAVQHAHQKGVVHRDLKPGNILVQSRDGYSEPKVIDFGVAKALQARLTERTLYTEQGRILGTPEYMSPEQAEMSILDVDTRSDIYSLGVLLYELLSGGLPFDSDQLLRAGFFEMQRTIREEEPLRPSTKSSTLDGELASAVAARRRTDPGGLCKALDGDLDWIAMRCLEKDPARRYASASELAADLQRHLDDEPVTAGPPSAWYRFRKLVRKHRGPLAAAGAVFVALTAGLSLALWQWGQARSSAERAEENLQAARKNELRATAAEQRGRAELTHRKALNLAGASDRALATDPIGALLLALQAVEIDDNPLMLARVQQALSRQYLVAELRGHTKRITSAVLGPKSHRVLTASMDGTVRVWSSEGKELLVLPHGCPVRSATFSTDEEYILTVSVPEDAREVASVFDRGGRLVRRIGDDAGSPFWSVAWNAEGRLLTSGVHGRIALRDIDGDVVQQLAPAQSRSGGPLWVHLTSEGHAVAARGGGAARRGVAKVWLEGEDEPIVLRSRDWFAPVAVPAFAQGSDGTDFLFHSYVRSRGFAIDPDRQLIAAIGRQKANTAITLTLWSLTGQPVAQVAGGIYGLEGVEFSPSGDTILTAQGDGTARLWNRQGVEIGAFNHSFYDGLRARFFGSDSRVVVSGRPGRVVLFNGIGRALAELNQGGSLTTLGDVAPSEGLILTTQRNNTAQLWRVSGAEPLHLRGNQDRPWRIVSLPTGEVLTTGESGRVLVFGPGGKLLEEFDTGSGRPTYGLAVSPDRALVVAGGADGMLYGWNGRSGEKLWERKIGEGPITRVNLAGGGQHIVAVDGPFGTAYWVDRASGASRVVLGPEASADGAPCHPNWAAVSCDGEIVALDTRNGFVRLCNAEGETLADLRVAPPDPSVGIWGSTFHPDGCWFATSAQGKIQFWDLREILEHGGADTPAWELTGWSVDFSPDGTRMLVGTGGSSYVTDLHGRETFQLFLEGSDNDPLPDRFSRDGKWLLAKTYDGVCRWPASREAALRMARELAERLGKGRDLKEYAHLLETPEDH